MGYQLAFTLLGDESDFVRQIEYNAKKFHGSAFTVTSDDLVAGTLKRAGEGVEISNIGPAGLFGTVEADAFLNLEVVSIGSQTESIVQRDRRTNERSKQGTDFCRPYTPTDLWSKSPLGCTSIFSDGVGVGNALVKRLKLIPHGSYVPPRARETRFGDVGFGSGWIVTAWRSL